MRKKLIGSIGIVAGLAIVAVVALVSTAFEVPVHDTLAYSAQSVTITEIEEPQVIIEPRNKENKEDSIDKKSLDWDAEESYLLAKIAMAEAEGEDTEGKAYVMLTILNRVWDDEFPNSIERVIYQSGQFSSVENGRFDEVEPDEDCYKALSMVQTQKWDESHGATYFESESESTWHSNNLKFLFRHGNHYFYKER